MMRTSFLLLIACWSISAVQGQILSGRVTDPEGHPVPYANIGLLHRVRGTVSGPQGEFRLSVDSLTKSDTLRISCIGYMPQTIAGNSLRNSDLLRVELAEAPQEIAEIVVLPGKERLRSFGHAFRKSGMTASFLPGQEGGEVGIVCRPKARQAQLHEARITLLGAAGIDTLHLRFNCYALHGEQVGGNLCCEPIFLSMPAPKSRVTLTIDLLPYDLWVTGDFLFTVENLTPMPEGAQFWFAAGLAGSCMSRYTSQSPWRHQFFGVGLQVDALTRE